LGVTGSLLIASWCESDSIGNRLMFGAVWDGGTEIVGKALSTSSPGLASQFTDATLVPRKSGWLLAVVSSSTRLVLYPVSASGEVGPATMVASPRVVSPFSGVAIGDHVVGAWGTVLNGETTVFAGQVSTSSDIAVDAGPVAPGPPGDSWPLVAAVGNEPLVVWTRYDVSTGEDLVGQWFATSEVRSVPLPTHQYTSAAAGGQQRIVVLAWEQARGLMATRLSPSSDAGFEPFVALAQTPTRLAALTAMDGGFLAAMITMRGDAGVLRLVPISETAPIDPSDGVWLSEGEIGLAIDGRPAIVPGWLSFVRTQLDGGSAIVVRPFGESVSGSPCRFGSDCLSGACLDAGCTGD